MFAQYCEHCVAQDGFVCSAVTPVRISRQLPFKKSNSSNLITCLDHYKNPRVDDDLPVRTKLKMWCICGFDHNRKLSWQMRSEALWTATQNALEKGRDYVEKWYDLYFSRIVYEVINSRKRLTFIKNAQTSCGAHPASCSMRTGVLPEHEAKHSPPSSAKVQNEWSYTFRPPICLHGLCRDNSNFYCRIEYDAV